MLHYHKKKDRKNVLDRLMRKQDEHKKIICKRILDHQKHDPIQMFSQIEIVNRGHQVYVKMNYTFYHWNLIEKLFFHRYNIRDIDPFTV